jgi:hypothetical protein
MALGGGLSPCPFCEGRGLATFDRGPEVEPCSECKGTGRLYSDESFKGIFAALLKEKGVFLDADMRLLLLSLDALDQRLVTLEDDAGRSK